VHGFSRAEKRSKFRGFQPLRLGVTDDPRIYEIGLSLESPACTEPLGVIIPYHTSKKLTRNSFPCHTSKTKDFKPRICHTSEKTMGGGFIQSAKIAPST
jgi:hypothetical protein